ncbi:hypothetical protein D910_07282 [Dendroctonus ponderosae]|uniref:C2H2-type domain-containing protein n=1 Tax=Dendroctonus ponderosae TaxID=77166 RepID=U4UC96_DENPD|nr:hypothetical protein D910_07282 [Dendroctonus ponderosae]
MKSEHLVVGGNRADPIWSNNVELLPTEVSSILQNLDSSHSDHNLQNMDLIILHENDYKLPLDGPLNLHTNNYIVLKDPIAVDHEDVIETPEKKEVLSRSVESSLIRNLQPTDLSLSLVGGSDLSNTSSISPPSKHYDKESFEDMLYFVCNLCPFLCTKETNITKHLENVHKNKTLTKLVQLKCPACNNIFYHRASLKSHLLHDHCVANSDLNLIVQAIVFYSNKENKTDELGKTARKDPATEKPLDSKDGVTRLITCDYSISQNGVTSKDSIKPELAAPEPSKPSNVELILTACSGQMEAETVEIPAPAEAEKILLPQVNITPNNSKTLITSLMKEPDPVVKYISSQKCVYASCKVILKDPKAMDYHIDSHLNNGFMCLECQETFTLWKPLTSHLWRQHKVDMELFACDKCDYKCNSLSKLNIVHKPIHSDVKSHQCETCLKAFKNQKQLRNHRRIHRDNVKKEPKVCDLCSKSFSDTGRFRSHMDSVHKKLKPFLCNYCGYKGSCKASLKMHIRSHTGEKPFSCDQCQYSTADHNSLRRHKLRHSGQKPYKCSYCPYACIQSSTYKVHLKTKHPGMEKDLMFTCFMCQFRTVNKDMYKSHLVSVHKQQPPDS